MPVKPNGNLCNIREQIVEDLASGLILQFECDDGKIRSATQLLRSIFTSN